MLDMYEFEHIQQTSAIMKKLNDEDAAHVLWLLSSLAHSLGYAQGMIEALKLTKPEPGGER